MTTALPTRWLAALLLIAFVTATWTASPASATKPDRKDNPTVSKSGKPDRVKRGTKRAPDCRSKGAKEAARATSCEPKQPKRRYGYVVELRPEKKELYLQLHENTWKDVLAQIRESNIRNYSIFMTELGGKTYLFAKFDYIGTDFEADMAKMAEDEATQLWWELTDPCQRRLPGTPKGQQWREMPEVFFTR